MATIVTVHGTFANLDAASIGTSNHAETQWWQSGSQFERTAHELLDGTDGRVDFIPFHWSSNNSEVERRKAGSRLLELLRDLDKRDENYCVVGHSHGGSVISAALVQSVAKGDPLKGLKKWITVGTPFIEMKREPFLFTRLNLFERMLFIASLMLFVMFAFYVAAEIWTTSGGSTLQRPGRFIVGSILMILPFAVFYTVLTLLDRQKLYLHRPAWIRRARRHYAHLWMPLCHENDEAVQGLKFLPRVDLSLFHRGFAISTISMGAMFVLPLIYLIMLTSPPIMIGMTEFMKNNLYQIDTYEQQTQTAETRRMDQLRRELRRTYRRIRQSTLDTHATEEARQSARQLRQEMRALRRKLQETNPEFQNYERAQRFKRRFLERDGKPCNPEGTLCGKGSNYAINAKLLFHAATDELASTIVTDEGTWGIWGGLLRLLVPIILVPLISVGVAMIVLALAGLVARYSSAALSWWLNRVTLAEVKRSAFGNDTEGEIALGADKQPAWTTSKLNYLPLELAELIAAYSNNITGETVDRFRKAITTLTFAEGEMKANMLATYFTWKELVHATYFEVPEFRKLVIHALARTEAFEAKPAFTNDPDYARTGQWLTEMEADNKD